MQRAHTTERIGATRSERTGNFADTSGNLHSLMCRNGCERYSILWDVESGNVAAFLEHKGPVHSLAFSPNGRTLVAGGELGELLMWSL